MVYPPWNLTSKFTSENGFLEFYTTFLLGAVFQPTNSGGKLATIAALQGLLRILARWQGGDSEEDRGCGCVSRISVTSSVQNKQKLSRNNENTSFLRRFFICMFWVLCQTQKQRNLTESWQFNVPRIKLGFNKIIRYDKAFFREAWSQ